MEDYPSITGLAVLLFTVYFVFNRNFFYSCCKTIAYPFYIAIQLRKSLIEFKNIFNENDAERTINIPVVTSNPFPEIAIRHWTDQTLSRRVVYSLFDGFIRRREFDSKTRRLKEVSEIEKPEINPNSSLRDVIGIWEESQQTT